jgi:trehalose 6-phosphate phosphatase
MEGILYYEDSSLAVQTMAGPVDPDWCLFLDVDGTLLEIAPTPDAVVVDESLKQLLIDTRRSLQGAVALISGRSIAALDRLFAPHRFAAAGLHGLERRDALGELHVTHVETGPGFDAAREALLGIVESMPGVLLEDKKISLAVHFRAVPQHEPALRRLVHAIAEGLGPRYQVLEGKRVLELKPAALTKGDAIRGFLAEAPFAGRRPVFVGDDITDLDGFAAVENLGGLSVAVGDRVDAQMRVASPRDVRALLSDLVEGRLAAP